MPISLEKRLAKRATILAVARSLLARDGYDGTTMHQIANEAGVAPATLYNVFGSKPNLLRQAVDELFQALVALARQRVGVGGMDRLVSYAENVLAEYERNPSYARNLLVAFNRSESSRPIAESILRVQNETFGLAAQEMQALGQLADWVTPEKVARLLAGMWSIAAREWAFNAAADVSSLRSEIAFGTYTILLGVSSTSGRSEIEKRLSELS